MRKHVSISTIATHSQTYQPITSSANVYPFSQLEKANSQLLSRIIVHRSLRIGNSIISQKRSGLLRKRLEGYTKLVRKSYYPAKKNSQTIFDIERTQIGSRTCPKLSLLLPRVHRKVSQKRYMEQDAECNCSFIDAQRDDANVKHAQTIVRSYSLAKSVEKNAQRKHTINVLSNKSKEARKNKKNLCFAGTRQFMLNKTSTRMDSHNLVLDLNKNVHLTNTRLPIKFEHNDTLKGKSIEEKKNLTRLSRKAYEQPERNEGQFSIHIFVHKKRSNC
eukprot:TRINITY_DN4991_c0_g1_i3.p1 TRINITY_DN4991_c0_g1~~TRINITY_DN4991_c0_g1_i3.p1  ORF type:complete len:275 (-),score=25.45 TRINITY_DN4991_c0_g1_i3:121-945(-)